MVYSKTVSIKNPRLLFCEIPFSIPRSMGWMFLAALVFEIEQEIENKSYQQVLVRLNLSIKKPVDSQSILSSLTLPCNFIRDFSS
jgi:hypothetical protein